MSAVSQSIAASGKWLHREFVAARPVFIFFLVAFLLQLLIIKLAVAQFSIPITAFSRAVVGALLAGLSLPGKTQHAIVARCKSIVSRVRGG